MLSNLKNKFVYIQVNENGLVSFLTEIPSFFNVEFPLDYPIIAALYSDVDCRGSGNVFYRIVNSANGSDLIDRSTDEVNRFFPRLSPRFRSQELVIVTWEKVGYFNTKADKVILTDQFLWSNNFTCNFIFHGVNIGNVRWPIQYA